MADPNAGWHLTHHTYKSASKFLLVPTAASNAEALHLVFVDGNLAVFGNFSFVPAPACVHALTPIILEVIVGHDGFSN